jgi:hypothetical protein
LIFELLAFGLIAGFMSGFFGIGGGTILVPILVLAGFMMKEAVAISIMQMVFSSIYGSFLNVKKAQHVLKDGLIIGFGGFVGGLQSGFIVKNVSNEFLQYIFIAVLVFSIVKIFYSPAQRIDEETKSQNKFILFVIGFFIGAVAMSIGIGGSIILAPILVGFLRYDLKVATALGLFFVIFSSVAGFISQSLQGLMLYYEGSIIGIASLVGVYFGIKVKNMVHSTSYKKYVLLLSIVVLIIMIYKTF